LAARFRGRGFKGGMIDELKIYRRELTALELGMLASAGTGRGEAGVESGVESGEEAAADDGRWLEYYLATVDEPARVLRAELKAARDRENDFIGKIPEIMTLGDLPVARATHVLKRGAYDAPGEVVEVDTPAAILPMDPQWPRNRLGLAEWLVSPRQPLTSRVLVNRYWQMFFGRGLVLTADNFGQQGALPSHPELLDWLAVRFMATGWDLKALCRMLVLSATYRQSTVAPPERLTLDPENVLLARGPRARLTAEMLRDGALAASGLLVAKVGGPSVKPYQPEGVWEDTAGAKYEPDKGEALYRRSLYTFWKRTAPHPAMITFDAAERNTCTVRRQATSTPLQALVLLNDPQFVEAARKVGERAMKEAGPRRDDRITLVFRLLTGRRPTRGEMPVLRRLLEEQLALFQAGAENVAALGRVGASAPDSALDAQEAAAFAALANAVMNFDEAIVKR